jgi:hypothetical protein
VLMLDDRHTEYVARSRFEPLRLPRPVMCCAVCHENVADCACGVDALEAAADFFCGTCGEPHGSLIDGRCGTCRTSIGSVS